MHSLGASQRDTLVESMIGTLGCVVLGVALAVLIAVAFSPLAPLGPVRPVYPDRGISWDWTVLGLGAALLLLVLGIAAMIIAVANSPERLEDV